jgi:hypothetical protein
VPKRNAHRRDGNDRATFRAPGTYDTAVFASPAVVGTGQVENSGRTAAGRRACPAGYTRFYRKGAGGDAGSDELEAWQALVACNRK